VASERGIGAFGATPCGVTPMATLPTKRVEIAVSKGAIALRQTGVTTVGISSRGVRREDG
jgi:hypothetical protein